MALRGALLASGARNGLKFQALDADAAVCKFAKTPHCDNIAEEVRKQRAKGQCQPNQPPKLQCTIGQAPTTRSYASYKVHQSCGEYYQPVLCVVTNAAVVSAPIGLAVDQDSPCELLQLGYEECLLLETQIRSFEQLEVGAPWEKQIAMALALSADLAAIAEKGPEEWMTVPSHRLAIELLSKTLEQAVEKKEATDIEIKFLGDNMGTVWRMLLQYCTQTQGRAIEEMKAMSHDRVLAEFDWDRAQDEAFAECKKATNLHLWAGYHPLWQKANEKFTGVDKLQDMADMGALHLDAYKWAYLAALANDEDEDGEHTVMFYNTLKTLISSAADRGAAEFELAIGFASAFAKPEGVNGLPADSEPEGGYDRLREMRVMEELQLSPEQEEDRAVLFKAISEAKEILGTGTQWVGESALQEAMAAAEARLAQWMERGELPCPDPPSPCSSRASDDFGRSVEEHNAKCLEHRLPEGCSAAALQEASDLARRCVAANLPEACTLLELLLQQRCAQLQITLGRECTAEAVAQAEAHEAACIKWGLGPGCSAEDIKELEAQAAAGPTTTQPQQCKVSEVTRAHPFGVSFLYDVTSCNKVQCRVVTFWENHLPKFVVPKQEAKKCTCMAMPGDYKLFEMPDSGKTCNHLRCWEKYSELMHKQLYPGLTLLPAQQIKNQYHWQAECVPSEGGGTQVSLPAVTIPAGELPA